MMPRLTFAGGGAARTVVAPAHATAHARATVVDQCFCRSGDRGRALRELPAEHLRLLERRLFLLEVLLEERDDVLLAHRLGLHDQTLVHRDLVVLGLANTRDDDMVVEAVVDHLQVRLPLLLEALDRRARRVVDLRAERLEDALEVLDVALRLLVVLPQRLLQMLVVCVVLEIGKHLENRLLHLQRRTELVDVELLRRLDRSAEDRHVLTPFCRLSSPGYPTRTKEDAVPRLAVAIFMAGVVGGTTV